VTWKPNARFAGNEEVARVNQSINDAEPVSETMRNQIGEPDTQHTTTPTIGVMGKNDRDFWATAPQSLILADEGGWFNSEKNLDLANDQAGTPRIGDKMKHHPGDHGAQYHAATMVAKDGNEHNSHGNPVDPWKPTPGAAGLVIGGMPASIASRSPSR